MKCDCFFLFLAITGWKKIELAFLELSKCTNRQLTKFALDSRKCCFVFFFEQDGNPWTPSVNTSDPEESQFVGWKPLITPFTVDLVQYGDDILCYIEIYKYIHIQLLFCYITTIGSQTPRIYFQLIVHTRMQYFYWYFWFCYLASKHWVSLKRFMNHWFPETHRWVTQDLICVTKKVRHSRSFQRNCCCFVWQDQECWQTLLW